MLWRDLSSWGWDPWREVERLQGNMDRLLTRLDQSRTPEFPALNVWSAEDDMVVTCELPGMDTKDLDISVVKETLTVKGVRKPEVVKENHRFHRRERGHGEFVRTIQLPYKVDAASVKAAYDRGILTITLPRAPEEKPRKISVRNA